MPTTYLIKLKHNQTHYGRIVSASLACTREELPRELARISGERPSAVVGVEWQANDECARDALREWCKLGETLRKRPKRLTCCCCGQVAIGRQWWNRDTGFGICTRCGESWGADVEQCCGKRGVHWGIAPELED